MSLNYGFKKRELAVSYSLPVRECVTAKVTNPYLQIHIQVIFCKGINVRLALTKINELINL